MMMKTFKASGGTEFFFDPALEGEIWITANAATVTMPVEDLMEFSAAAAKVPERGTSAELDLLMRILDGCGVFDPRQSREVTRRRLATRLRMAR